MNWRRFLKIGGIMVGVAVIATIGFAVWFLFIFTDYTDTEVARFPNPSGSVEAVVVERSGNATVAMATIIYVIASGEDSASEMHFLADHVDGLAINWIDDQTVHIHADNARVFSQPAEINLEGAIKRNVRVTYQILNVER